MKNLLIEYINKTRSDLYKVNEIKSYSFADKYTNSDLISKNSRYYKPDGYGNSKNVLIPVIKIIFNGEKLIFNVSTNKDAYQYFDGLSIYINKDKFYEWVSNRRNFIIDDLYKK